MINGNKQEKEEQIDTNKMLIKKNHLPLQKTGTKVFLIIILKKPNPYKLIQAKKQVADNLIFKTECFTKMVKAIVLQLLLLIEQMLQPNPNKLV